MKNFSIILLIALMSTATLIAQRIGDPPPLSRFNGIPYSFGRNKQILVADTSKPTGYRLDAVHDTSWNATININFNDTSLFVHQPKEFLFGYHWSYGSNKLIERRIGFNMPMSHFGWDRTLREGSTLNNLLYDTTGPFIMSDHFGIVDGHPYNRTIHLILLYTLFVNDYQRGVFRINPLIEWRPATPPYYHDSTWKPIKGDKFGSIFGFYNKQGGKTITDSTDDGFMGYALHPDSITTGSRLVLSKPTMQTEFRRSTDELPYTRSPNYGTRPDTTTVFPDSLRKPKMQKFIDDSTKLNKDSSDLFGSRLASGNHWFLSVNLRRLPHTTTNNLSDTNKVLTLKIKYWYRISTEINTVQLLS